MIQHHEKGRYITAAAVGQVSIVCRVQRIQCLPVVGDRRSSVIGNFLCELYRGGLSKALVSGVKVKIILVFTQRFVTKFDREGARKAIFALSLQKKVSSIILGKTGIPLGGLPIAPAIIRTGKAV